VKKSQKCNQKTKQNKAKNPQPKTNQKNKIPLLKLYFSRGSDTMEQQSKLCCWFWVSFCACAAGTVKIPNRKNYKTTGARRL